MFYEERTRLVDRIQVRDVEGRIRTIDKLAVDIKLKPIDGPEHWEPSGNFRYSLEGRAVNPVRADKDGYMLATGEYFTVLSGSLD